MTQADWATLVAGWFPHLADTRLRQTTWPEIARRHEYITAQLKLGVRQATIHQRLRHEHGLLASVASLKQYVAANLPEEVRRDRVVVLRDESDIPPGPLCQDLVRQDLNPKPCPERASEETTPSEFEQPGA